MVARVSMPSGDGTRLWAGELEIRVSEGLVLARGRALTLSVREFELLAALVQRAGTIVTREQLHRSVWSNELRPGSRSVDVYVSKLRRKLQSALPDRRFIHTHPGFGYRFDAEPALGDPHSAMHRAAADRSAGRGDPSTTWLSRDVHIAAAPG